MVEKAAGGFPEAAFNAQLSVTSRIPHASYHDGDTWLRWRSEKRQTPRTWYSGSAEPVCCCRTKLENLVP